MGGFADPNSTLTAPKRANPLVELFILLCHVVHWTLQRIFQPPPASQNVPRGSHSVTMGKTYPKHINLFTPSASSKHQNPSLTSKLPAKFAHHILPKLRRQPYTNTEIPRTLAHNGHDSEQYISILLASPIQTRTSIRHPFTDQCHRYPKLANCNPTSSMHKKISSDTRPPDEVQTSK